MKKDSKHIYQLELTERQAKLLSYACDQFMRCIQGQPEAFQSLMEEAWEKRCKEEMRHHMAVLLQANRYMRDDNSPAIYGIPNPKELGQAIDFAVMFMETFSEL